MKMFASILALMAATGETDTRYRMDAASTAFLERELVQVRSKIFEKKYAENKALTFVPIATDIDPNVETFTQKVYDQFGMAKIIAAGGGRDLPRVDVNATEITGKVYTIGDSFGWSLMELRAATFAKVNLSDRKASAARRAIETAIDLMVAFGGLAAVNQPASVLTTTGMLNNANVPTYTFLYVWDDAATTSDQILADLNGFAAQISIITKQIFKADTLLLAPTWFNYLSNRPYSTLNPKSVLQVFLENQQYIRNIDQWYALEDAGSGGAPRCVAYARNSEVLEAVVPNRFEMLPAQVHGLETEVPCIATCGGVCVYHPLAMLYGDRTHDT